MKPTKKRDLNVFPLTDTEIARIQRLMTTGRMAPVVIAEQFGIQVKQVDALKRSRSWSRSPREYNVAPPGFPARYLKTSEIAAVAGISRVAVYMRLSQGITGPALLSSKRTLPRKKKGLAGKLGERIDKIRGVYPNHRGRPVDQPPESERVRMLKAELEKYDGPHDAPVIQSVLKEVLAREIRRSDLGDTLTFDDSEDGE